MERWEGTHSKLGCWRIRLHSWPCHEAEVESGEEFETSCYVEAGYVFIGMSARIN